MTLMELIRDVMLALAGWLLLAILVAALACRIIMCLRKALGLRAGRRR